MHNGQVQDKELYRRILGIRSPWYVERVDLKLEEGEVHVYLEHQEGALAVSGVRGGGRFTIIKRSGAGAIWTPANTRPFCTRTAAQQCPEHGVRVVKLPWAEPSSRFTALFEGLAIEWLKAASQKAVGDQLGLSWDEVHGIRSGPSKGAWSAGRPNA